MLKFLRVRKVYLAIGAALMVWMVSTVDATFAQVSYPRLVTIPDANVPNLPIDPNLPVTPVTPVKPGSPVTPVSTGASITLDFSGVKSVTAKEIALVSLASRQVDLAKTSKGAKSVAKTLISQKYKWGANQVGCLNVLWDNESHWNFQARNPRSGAQGIAQAMPASKMESVALDWRTNPVTQIKWGLNYIKDRYGTPCAALAKKHWAGYY